MDRPMPNGKYGTDSVYAFLLQAYRATNDLPLFACARPQTATWAGQPVTLDASNSNSDAGAQEMRYEWSFDDGTKATGPIVKRTYNKPGYYKPIVEVTDSKGRNAIDFAEVHILDPKSPKNVPPSLHAACWPTKNLRVGQPIEFLVRSSRDLAPEKEHFELWDFGDGSPKVRTKSDGVRSYEMYHDPNGYALTKHRYTKPGQYIVTVRTQNSRGETAVDRLWITIEP
jgi:PKD domain